MDNISSQERDDFALAEAEYRSALARYKQILERHTQIQPVIRHLESSAYLAGLQVEASANVLGRLRDHYAHLRAAVLANLVASPIPKRGGSALSSPTESEYFSVSESRPTTPVNQDHDANNLQDGLRLTLSPEHHGHHNFQVTQGHNEPVTPTPPPPGQPRNVPVTPTPPPGQVRNAPITPARPTPSQPSTAPVTPSWYAPSSQVANTMSPFPNQKHYSVVRGRRVGVYSGWNHVKPLVEGLGDLGSQQSFGSYDAAVFDYFAARARGYVKVVRLPGDRVDVFGAEEEAEDIPDA